MPVDFDSLTDEEVDVYLKAFESAPSGSGGEAGEAALNAYRSKKKKKKNQPAQAPEGSGSFSDMLEQRKKNIDKYY